MADERGTTHVELDESGAAFEPDADKYAPSDG